MFNSEFELLNDSERAEVVVRLKQALAARNFHDARAVIQDVIVGAGHLKSERSRRLLQLAWLVVSLFIVFGAPFKVAFGPFSSATSLVIEFLMMASYASVLLWEKKLMKRNSQHQAGASAEASSTSFSSLLSLLLQHESSASTSSTSSLFWLILDVTALLPLGLLLGSPLLELARLVCWGRLLRALRQVTRSALTRLASLLLLLVVCAHLVACSWYGLGVYQEFASDWGPSKELSQTPSLLFKYGKTFHYSLRALTQGPEGSPNTELELLLSLGIIFLGFSVYATIIGSIGNVLTDFDQESSEWISKSEQIDRYCVAHGLPRTLTKRVKDYFEYLRAHSKTGITQQEIFAELPDSLKTDISLHLTKDLLAEVAFFKKAPLPCLSLIAKLLKPISVPPGERIITEGEVGQSMYFLMRGLLEVSVGLNVVSVLHDGAFFGEMALLIENQPRTATIRALVFSDVFELSRDDLEHVMDVWPSLRIELVRTMEERIASTKEVKAKVDDKVQQRLSQRSSFRDIWKKAANTASTPSSADNTDNEKSE